VVFAEHGEAAIARLREHVNHYFDVILMDIQMPVMDGYEASRQILKLAASPPIIGLTAHALLDERKRCLEAGMVEHLSKPVEIDILVAAILSHTLNSNEHLDLMCTLPTPVPANQTEPSDSLIDLPALLQRFGSNQPFVDRLIKTVSHTYKDSASQLNAAAQAGDHAAIANLAHAIKGMAGNLFAKRLQEYASATENAARQGTEDALAHALELAHLINKLLHEINVEPRC
jgi:CheY-like chemotaxis protein